RDLLIGGMGSDRLAGNADDDILIAGFTDYDALDAALQALMVEWSRTDLSYAVRVAHLQGGVGAGSVYRLTNLKVHDDEAADVLTGSSGEDWFFANIDGDGNSAAKDKVTDLQAEELWNDLNF